MNVTYCSGKGLSSPSWIRKAMRACSLAIGFMSVFSGVPGAMRRKAKITIEAAKMTTRVYRARRTK
jgi:hypothetical protein